MSMCLCPHLGVLVYISETMASLHPRWLAGLSVVSPLPFPRPAQLLWHQWCHKHRSLSVDPHSIASINPHISYTEPASRLFVHSNWEALQFFLLYFKTKSNSGSEKKRLNHVWITIALLHFSQRTVCTGCIIARHTQVSV